MLKYIVVLTTAGIVSVVCRSERRDCEARGGEGRGRVALVSRSLATLRSVRSTREQKYEKIEGFSDSIF